MMNTELPILVALIAPSRILARTVGSVSVVRRCASATVIRLLKFITSPPFSGRLSDHRVHLSSHPHCECDTPLVSGSQCGWRKSSWFREEARPVRSSDAGLPFDVGVLDQLLPVGAIEVHS